MAIDRSKRTAIIDIGKIRIIPDLFTYAIWYKGGIVDVANTGSTTIGVDSASHKYNMLDHRVANVTTLETNSVSGDSFRCNASGGISSYPSMILFVGDNITNKDGKVVLMYNTTEKTNVTATINATHEGSGNYTKTDTDFLYWGFETTEATGINGFRINENSGTYDGDIDIGIVHLGAIFEMPVRPSSNMSLTTRSFNKVRSSTDGYSYSTLYNPKTQRILKVSWEFINWGSGAGEVDEFIDMIEFSYGSQVPVAVQLSQTGTVTSEPYSTYFLFCIITSWKKTQMSPSLWKISATFEEYI